MFLMLVGLKIHVNYNISKMLIFNKNENIFRNIFQMFFSGVFFSFLLPVMFYILAFTFMHIFYTPLITCNR